MADTPRLIQNDPWLEPYKDAIVRRMKKALEREEQLAGKSTLQSFASGHLWFGLHRQNKDWVIREWAPHATEIFLTGSFNNWQIEEKYRFEQLEHGNWEIRLDEGSLTHGDLFKLLIRWEGGEGRRIPAWCNRVVQDPETKVFDAQVWNPAQAYQWKNPLPELKDLEPLIYEAHIGMATEEFKVGSYSEFREKVLPHVIRGGYNTLQLMAIQEHPYYGSFGYHVSNFFASSSRFGTPEELKELIDEAHKHGIAVIMDIVHSHAVKNENEGLGLLSRHIPEEKLSISPVISNEFRRVTFVNPEFNERMTLDFNLSYRSNGPARFDMPRLAILELKTFSGLSGSRAAAILKEMGVHPIGFSKYCVGVAVLCNPPKKNIVKTKLLLINKIENEYTNRRSY